MSRRQAGARSGQGRRTGLGRASFLLAGVVALALTTTPARGQPAGGAAASEDSDATGAADTEGDAETGADTAPQAPPAGDAAGAAPAPDDSARDEAIFGGDPGAEAGPADDAARDADIFGAGVEKDDSTTPGREEGSLQPAPGPGDEGAPSRDEAMLGDPGDATVFASDVAPDDPLTIGGLLYLRGQSFILQGQPPEDWSYSAPELAQVYLDMRPNERVRGFAQFRLQFDPTLPASAEQALGTGGPLAPGASTDGVQSLSAGFQTNTRNVRFAIDQLWLNFDINHKVFVTAGKVHDRWGTGRFWMPTDYLHLQNRNPINIFDSRTGTNMLKVHVPVESLAWNFMGYAVIEDPFRATDTLSRIAGAFRAEFVLGTAELGLGIFARRGSGPRYAADLSFGVWDFDFYGELAVRDAGNVDRVRFDPDAEIPPFDPPPSWQSPLETAEQQFRRVVDVRYPVYRDDRMRPQAVGGMTYSRRYYDTDVITFGAEYFYNGLGYDSPEVYPGLILPHTQPLQNSATFFYLGEHYLALFVAMPAPYSLDLHTFSFSTLGNLSDGSYLSRFDYAYTLLTHLTLEAFVAVHYGKNAGEFRFGVEAFALGEMEFSQPPALVDLGLALRLPF